jgi:hypothetical protein
MSSIRFSHAEVTSIGQHGFWLQFRDEELYLSFVEFPRFEHATIAQIFHVQCLSASRLYWPELRVDLGIEKIRNPMSFPHHGLSEDC